MIYEPIPEKRCRVCGLYFPATLDYFYRGRRYKDKILTLCKKCKNTQDTQNRDRAHTRERVRAWKLQHPDQVKQYKKPSPEKSREYGRKYRLNHAEEIREEKRAYSRNNREKRRVIELRYEARKRGLPDTFTANDWQRCLEYFGHCCAACGRPRGLWHTIAADHWIPITNLDSPGTIAENIVPLCQGIEGCNNSKGNRHPIEWLASRFGVRKTKRILARVNAYFEVVKGRK